MRPFPSSRRAVVICALLALVAFHGCGDDDDDPERDPVLIGTDYLTGFYLNRVLGGRVMITVQEYEPSSQWSPTRPGGASPTEVLATLEPDDGDPPILLTGTFTRLPSGTTIRFSGAGYDFGGSYSKESLTFTGGFTGPGGNGVFAGYLGPADSVPVYCGTFDGTLLGGRWHFAVREDRLMRGAAVSVDPAATLAFSGSVSEAGPPWTLIFGGTGPADFNVSGQGTADPDTASGTWALSGDADSGTWSAGRMPPDSSASISERLAGGEVRIRQSP